MNKNTSKLKQIAIILLFIIIIAIGAYLNNEEENQTGNIIENNKISYDILNIPEYSGEIFIEINNNVPQFTAQDISIQKDYYSDLENGLVTIDTKERINILKFRKTKIENNYEIEINLRWIKIKR